MASFASNPIDASDSERPTNVLASPVDIPVSAVPQLSVLPDFNVSNTMTDADARLLLMDLEAAKTIQESFLPKTFPTLPGFEFAGFCRSARQVGGDFFDVVSLPNEAALLVVADVMGKGIGAALLASTLRALIRSLVHWTQRPADMLARLNAALHQELSNVDTFITAQIAVVDAAQSKLTIASAGHHPCLLCDGHGGIMRLLGKGLPLGISPAATYSEEHAQLLPGSSVVLYTDGLSDARDSQGSRFGEDRLAFWLSTATAGNLSSAQELKDRLVVEIANFQSGALPSDDQTLLLLAPARRELQMPQLSQTAVAA